MVKTLGQNIQNILLEIETEVLLIIISSAAQKNEHLRRGVLQNNEKNLQVSFIDIRPVFCNSSFVAMPEVNQLALKLHSQVE